MTWTSMRSIPAGARLQAHWAAQIPASVGHQLLDKKPDWSHTALRWMPSHRAMVSGVVQDRFRAGLALDDLSLLLMSPDGRVLERMALAGQKLQTGFDWLSERFGVALTFSELTIPEHAVRTDGALLDVDPAALKQLADTYANAHLVCEATRAADARAADTLLWPHHFDMATLVELDRGTEPEEARSIGVGLSPGDGYYAEPYFYVMPWPYPPPAELPNVPGVGHWHTEEWTGAALPISDLPAEGQEAAVLAFAHGYRKASEAILSG